MNHILNLLVCDGNCLPDLKLNHFSESEQDHQVQMNFREKPQVNCDKPTTMHSQTNGNYMKSVTSRGIQLKSPIKEYFHYQGKQKCTYNKFTPKHLSLLKNSRQNIIKKRIKPLKKMNSQTNYYETYFQTKNRQIVSHSVQMKTYTPKHYPQKIDQLEESFQINIQTEQDINIQTKRPRKICQYATALKLKHKFEQFVHSPLVQKPKVVQILKKTQNIPKTPKILKLRTPYLRLTQTPQIIQYSYFQTQYNQNQPNQIQEQRKILKQMTLQKQILQSQFKNLKDQENILIHQHSFLTQNLQRKIQTVSKTSFQLKLLSQTRELQIKQIEQFIQITKQRARVNQIFKNIEVSGLQIEQYYAKDSIQLDTEVDGKDDSRLSFD